MDATLVGRGGGGQRCICLTNCQKFYIWAAYLVMASHNAVNKRLILWFIEENPPAWTQETYRPPRSKSLGEGTYLGWGKVPIFARGVPTLARGIPTLAWGYPPLLEGYLPWPGGYLHWPGSTYLGQGVPTFAMGGYLPWPGGTHLGWCTPRSGQTNKLKLLPSPILRIRTVKTGFTQKLGNAFAHYIISWWYEFHQNCLFFPLGKQQT